MDAKRAREFYLDYLNTIYNERKVEQLGRFYAADVIAHPELTGRPPGLPGVQAAVQEWVDAFSDMHITLDGLVYEKDMMAARITIIGTHTGPFLGIAPTGKRIQIIDQPHYQLREGKIVEFWDLADVVTLLMQLGANPFPQAA